MAGTSKITGNLTATGTVQAEQLTTTDDLTVTGLATVGETLVVTGALSSVTSLAVSHASGAAMTRKRYDSGITAVATGGAATTITLSIPSGEAVVAYAFAVTTTIADIDSTTGTLEFTGGSTANIGTVSTFTSGTVKDSILSGSNYPVVLTDVTNATFTLSGGADNTPSAGAIRLVVFTEAITSITV